MFQPHVLHVVGNPLLVGTEKGAASFFTRLLHACSSFMLQLIQ